MPLNVEQLQRMALQNRHDLKGWSYLARQINETSAPIFAKMISTLIGGWGMPLPSVGSLKNLICPPDHSGLTANMRHELNLTVETHRRWICQAIEEKAAKLQLTYQRIELAQQTIRSWESRLDQLEQLAEMGEAEAEQRALARVGLMEARGEEIRRRLEAKIAEVDLAEASGGLASQGLPWLLTGNE